MVIESKEEVFEWFKNLSGAKRVEVMYGLFNMSIPLEWRLFATTLENLARRDFLVLKDDEFKSNTPKEIETVCSLPWLDTTPISIASSSSSISPSNPNEVSTSAPTVNGVSSSTTSPDSSPRESRSASPTPSTSSSANDKPSPSSVRSKVVIYLCLLNSTNRVCASILFEALKNQLSSNNIRKHVEKLTQLKETALVHNNNVIAHMMDSTPGAITTSSRTSSSETVNGAQSSQTQARQPMNVFTVDQHFVAEITLMYTLAIHHPAFSFEMQQRLIRSLTKVRLYLDGLVSSATLAPLSLSARSNMSSSSLIPGVNFPTISKPPVNISQLATLKQQVGQRSPTIRVTTKMEKLSVQTTATDSTTGGKQLNVSNFVSPTHCEDHSCSECSMDCPTYATSNICQKNSNTSMSQNRLGANNPVSIPSPLIPNVQQTVSGQNNQVNGTSLLQTSNAVGNSRLSLDTSSEISNVMGHCPSCNCSCSTNISAPYSLTTSPSSSPPPLTPTSVSSSTGHLPQSHNSNINNVDNHFPCWFMFPPNTLNPTPEWLQQYYQNWTYALSHTNNPVQYWPQFHLPLMANNMGTPTGSFSYNSVAEAFNTDRQKPMQKSCYNCGETGHRGDECVKETLDDVTRASMFNLDFTPVTQQTPTLPVTTPPSHIDGVADTSSQTPINGSLSTQQSISHQSTTLSRRQNMHRPTRQAYDPRVARQRQASHQISTSGTSNINSLQNTYRQRRSLEHANT